MNRDTLASNFNNGLFCVAGKRATVEALSGNEDNIGKTKRRATEAENVRYEKRGKRQPGQREERESNQPCVRESGSQKQG